MASGFQITPGRSTERPSLPKGWSAIGKGILLTGRPGSGKTTAVLRILPHLPRPAGGFYTEEIRENGVRAGFRIVTLDGRQGILAHFNIQSRNRVGRYGVDTGVVETLAVESIRRAVAENRIVVIDEIGPMEIFSALFCQAVMVALASQSPVLGTIVKRPNVFADKVKALPDITLVEVTLGNRDIIAHHILELFK